MTTAGEINVKLGLNSDAFVKEMDKAEKELKELEDNLKTSETQFNAVAKAMAMSKNPSKELQSAFKQLKSELKTNKSAFEDFNSKLNKFDGGLTKGKEGVNLLNGAFGKLVAGGTIIAATKKIIDFSKQSVAAFREQDRALKNLDNALYNAGVYSDSYASHLKELSSEIQSYSNYGDEAVEKALSLGQAYAGNIKLTDDLIKATVDYAAATGTDLDTAFNLVGKSIGTSTNALARYGVKLDDSMTKEQKMAVITETLGQRFKGSAENMADSSVQLQNAIGDLKESFGSTLDGYVKNWQGGMTKIIQWTTRVIDRIRAMRGEISALSNEDLIIRQSKNQKQIEYLEQYSQKLTKYSAGYKDTLKDIAKLKSENTFIAEQIKYNTKEAQKQAELSKKNYVSPTVGGTSKSVKQAQDKTLEEYKKYIDEYAKLTSNYEATLKARQYVEGTLNIDPVTQQQEYDKMLALYQQHYTKLTEIAQSGAKNKAEIEKLEEEKLVRDLKEIRVNSELETQRQLADMIQEYNSQAEGIDTSVGFGTGFLSGLSAQYKAKLDLERWYQAERRKIVDDTNYSIEEQAEAFASLDNLRNAMQVETNLKTWQQYGNDIAGILNNSFTSILTGQEGFNDGMAKLLASLQQQLLKMAMDYVTKDLEITKAWALAKRAWNLIANGLSAFSFGGIGGVATGVGASIVGGGMMYPVDPMLPTYHSGGLVPGTKEQMAVLKGGERVLNPAENVSYTNGDETQSGVNNIMVFNIKAWDGKDVINTLKANSQTINQIVSSGIKNNNQGLRTTVQNI